VQKRLGRSSKSDGTIPLVRGFFDVFVVIIARGTKRDATRHRFSLEPRTLVLKIKGLVCNACEGNRTVRVRAGNSREILKRRGFDTNLKRDGVEREIERKTSAKSITLSRGARGSIYWKVDLLIKRRRPGVFGRRRRPGADDGTLGRKRKTLAARRKRWAIVPLARLAVTPGRAENRRRRPRE